MSAPRVRVRDIADAAHPSASREKNLLVLRFYGDTSRRDGHRILVAAGYINPAKKWEKFEIPWQCALNDAGVDYFHATDFFACRREFKGWVQNSPKQNEFSERFARIANKRAGLGLALGVDVEAFGRVLAPVIAGVKTPHGRFTPLMFVAIKLLSIFAKMLWESREQIAVVFEREDGMGEVIDYFNFAKKRRESWTDHIVSFTQGEKQFLPLQAADLLAHESWRRAVEYVEPTGRPIRKPLQHLLTDNRLRVDLFLEEQIRKSLPQMMAYLANNPDGVRPPPKRGAA